MKKYIYYANEENCYEIEKFETNNPIAEIKEFLIYEGFDRKEANKIAKNIVETANKNGYDYTHDIANDEYEFVVGVANYGYCSKMRNVIVELQKEMMLNF